MKVDVQLFGGLAARAGTGRVAVDLPEGATAASVVTAIAAEQPDLGGLLPTAMVAVNLEVVPATSPIGPDDEIALLPPVAGGSAAQPLSTGPTIVTGLRRGALSVDATLAEVSSPAVGATAVFLGTVRDHSPATSEVHRLDYTAYEEMAETTLRAIAEEVAHCWPALEGVVLLHAVGELPVGAPTVLIVCSAPHREEAFTACRHALEEVKSRVPVWKREVGPDGEHWVGLEGGATRSTGSDG
jgi:MoaE-MoaD fusion protein